MESISILRYLPTINSNNRLRKRWKDWWHDINLEYSFAIEKSIYKKYSTIVKIRESLNVILTIIGPSLAIISLIFKFKTINLSNNNNILFTFNNGFLFWFKHIILYIGLLNQIIGFRNIKDIEMNALQHFVFRFVLHVC